MYYEWADFWNPPAPGYPLFWIDGETESPNCGPGPCVWNVGDPHKMHYPQLPDETGWDVNATQPLVLADDWECSETGWVKDIHFWGSWRHDDIGQVIAFVLSIHEDIPVGAPIPCYADGDCNGDGMPLTVADMAYLLAYLTSGGPAPIPPWSGDLNGDCVTDMLDVVVYQDFFTYGLPVFDPYGGYPVLTCCDEVAEYSRPGQTLWEFQVEDFDIVGIDPPSLEGWYDPSTGEVFENDHQHYFQYNVCLDESMWFWQDAGTIYWLNISAIIADPVNTQWGWKSTQDHWNDDAVWAYWGELDWIDMWEPGSGPSLVDTNWFGITVDPFGTVLESWGTDHYGQGWYYYPQSEWWNIWFYDHPFTYDRYKEVWIEFDAFLVDPAQPAWLEFALNYSTDWWSLTGNPPTEPRVPPLPGDDEELGIIRSVALQDVWFDGHYSFGKTIPEYNPEWVSIDVRGYNFYIPDGWIIHECKTDNPPQSLDLSFVITGGDGPPTEACCFDDGSCVDLPPDDCITQGGSPQGPGSVCSTPEACCLADGSCIMADPLCCNWIGGIAQGPGTSCSANMEACCLPDGSCIMADPLCCQTMFGGIPQGAGTSCTALEACCLSDGTCIMVDPLCCVSIFNGIPEGPGSTCTTPEGCCIPGADCMNVDPLCCVSIYGGVPTGPGSSCTQPEACCLPSGACIMVDPLCCVMIHNGAPQGIGTQCTAPQACCIGSQCQMLDPLCCLDLNGTPQGSGTDCSNVNCDECDCIPGDANGDGAVNVGDAVYVIAYVFKGGPPPTPYAICSGDANCDCSVNVGDAVYIIAYVFKGGPPPCECTGPLPPYWNLGWLELCGPPLRK
jgi:hypothetical protein